MPQMQFPVVTQRRIPVQRVQRKIVIPHVQRMVRWSMFLLCRITGPRHGRDGRDPTVADRAARHVEVPETKTPRLLRASRASMAPIEMVEKVEMNVAMLTAGVEKRARPSSPTCRSLRRRSAHQVSAATVCTTQLEHREYDDRHRHQQACWRTLHRRGQQD